MRVILAHNSLIPIGGAEVFYLETGRVLEEHGHDVAYFSPLDKGIESPWSEYFPAAFNHENANSLSGLLSLKDLIYSSDAKEKFKKLIKEFKPDIVHCFSIYVRLTPSILDAAREMNVPIVMSCNDYKHICPNYKLFQGGNICTKCKGGKFYNAVKYKCAKNSFKYSFASALEAYVHDFIDVYKKNVDVFLFASEFMATMTKDFWGDKNFSWKILSNPFDSTKYSVSESEGNYVLYFGRLIDEKGVDILIKSFEKLPHVNLKIVGTGPDEDNLKQLAAKMPHIEFLGPKWDDELEPLIDNARFVVVPSVWHENFPYVILQSFAKGKAVIGTDRGGIPELIQDGTYGLIYEADNYSQLSDKVSLLWRNKELSRRMGIAAKKRVDKQFNDQQFYENVHRIYSNVIN